MKKALKREERRYSGDDGGMPIPIDCSIDSYILAGADSRKGLAGRSRRSTPREKRESHHTEEIPSGRRGCSRGKWRAKSDRRK